MKIVLILLAVFVIVILGANYTGFDIGFEKSIKRSSPTVQKEVDYKASFAIFTNGSLRDFTSSKYHNLSKDVFVTSENPSIVNVKKKGITWNDFFKTLPSPMKLSKDCLITGTGEEFCTNKAQSLKFYLNGIKDDNLLSKTIRNGDKALITYGNESETEIKMQLKVLE